MKVDLTPPSAFRFLQAIDSRHPWVLTTEQSDTDQAMRFTVQIDGTASAHSVFLSEDGTWTMATDVEP